ncbi:lysoplasmalogenase [Pedobacter sp. PWIIR3]
MLKRHLTFTLLCLIVLVAYLFGAYYHVELVMRTIQLFLMVLLIAFFVVETKLKGRFHKRLAIGLFLSIIGDVFMILSSKDSHYSSYGFVGLLLCHLWYTSAFYLDFRSAPELDKKTARIALFVCALFSTSFFFFLRPHLGNMRIPVLLFTLIVSFMVLMAIFRNLRVNKISFKLILAAALLFILSDATLAVNHFFVKIDHATIYVAISYLIAQYLIVLGGIERKLIATE